MGEEVGYQMISCPRYLTVSTVISTGSENTHPGGFREYEGGGLLGQVWRPEAGSLSPKLVGEEERDRASCLRGTDREAK